jgi:hypothetical protein
VIDRRYARVIYGTAVSLVLLFICQVWSKGKPPIDGYTLLRSVQSPVDLLLPHLPGSYTVSVTLSGGAADEMKRTLEKLKLEAPRYEEVFDSGRRFYLNLSNANYPLETRECITGILNPVEMMEIVMASALKYRDKDMFSIIMKETNVSTAMETIDGKRIYKVQVVPKGRYFAYSYQDKGAYARESWLTALTLVMDSASHQARELVLQKYSRHYEAVKKEKPPVDSFLIRYSFMYGSFDGVVLPTELTLWVNGAQTLFLSASYRVIDGRYRVFDIRKICSSVKDSASCLTMQYGTYRTGEIPAAVRKPVRPAAYAKDLEHAAQLSREALASLREGNIESSVRICKKIIGQYPETPQAVEARRLLSGLPGGK